MSESVDGIDADLAREKHKVSGARITVAVIDSGCLDSHVAFSPNRISRNGKNFTGQGPANDTSDTIGHGTSVAGIIVGDAPAPGVAPGAVVLPLKVVSEDVESRLSSVRDALNWLLGDGRNEGASIVCLSLGDDGNYQAEQGIAGTKQEDVKREIAARIRELRQAGIPTVVAVGNTFRCKASAPGMAFPAILPECLSVGAVFRDGLLKNVSFGAGYCDAGILRSQRNQIAPFSQRLPRGESFHFTRLFAPGVEIVSLGHATDVSEAPPSSGTSLAAPFVAGVVALLQELYKKRHNGDLPSCDKLEQWLRQGGERIVDDAGDDDNVTNTGAAFKALNALGAIEAMLEDIPTPLWHLS